MNINDTSKNSEGERKQKHPQNLEKLILMVLLIVLIALGLVVYFIVDKSPSKKEVEELPVKSYLTGVEIAFEVEKFIDLLKTKDGYVDGLVCTKGKCVGGKEANPASLSWRVGALSSLYSASDSLEKKEKYQEEIKELFEAISRRTTEIEEMKRDPLIGFFTLDQVLAGYDTVKDPKIIRFALDHGMSVLAWLKVQGSDDVLRNLGTMLGSMLVRSVAAIDSLARNEELMKAIEGLPAYPVRYVRMSSAQMREEAPKQMEKVLKGVSDWYKYQPEVYKTKSNIPLKQGWCYELWARYWGDLMYGRTEDIAKMRSEIEGYGLLVEDPAIWKNSSTQDILVCADLFERLSRENHPALRELSWAVISSVVLPFWDSRANPICEKNGAIVGARNENMKCEDLSFPGTTNYYAIEVLSRFADRAIRFGQGR